MHGADMLHVLVSDVLATGEPAARVFIGHRMAGCVGCPFAPFETVAEAAASCGVDPDELAASLLAAGIAPHSSKGLPS